MFLSIVPEKILRPRERLLYMFLARRAAVVCKHTGNAVDGLHLVLIANLFYILVYSSSRERETNASLSFYN